MCRVVFRYEKLSDFCYYCGRLDHQEKDCGFVKPDGKRYFGTWLRANGQNAVTLETIINELDRLNAKKPDVPFSQSPRIPKGLLPSTSPIFVPEWTLSKSKSRVVSLIPYPNLNMEEPNTKKPYVHSSLLRTPEWNTLIPKTRSQPDPKPMADTLNPKEQAVSLSHRNKNADAKDLATPTGNFDLNLNKTLPLFLNSPKHPALPRENPNHALLLFLAEANLIPTDELLSMFARNLNEPFAFGAIPLSKGPQVEQAKKMNNKMKLKNGNSGNGTSEDKPKTGMKRIIKQDYFSSAFPKKPKLQDEALPESALLPTEKMAVVDEDQPRRQP